MCTHFWNQGVQAQFANENWEEKTRRSNPVSPFTDHSGNLIVRTEEIAWIDNFGNERCRFHRYITARGELGGSGYPDPKRILLGDGTRYRLTRPPEMNRARYAARLAMRGQ